MVTRVDRPDWKEHMAREHSPWDAKRGTDDGPRWVRCLGDGAADHYRRVYSMDSIEGVPEPIFKLVPGSNWDTCGYIEVTQ